MGQALNTKRIGHIDCAGGGQVCVDGTTLYIGHMRYPSGTTVVDVEDPANPRVLATIEMPDGWLRRDLEETDTSPSSRYIPAAVRRAVAERDGNQCTFVDAEGRRCKELQSLQFHHRDPYARGVATGSFS